MIPRSLIAPVIPTDRVSLEELPEEKQPVEDLVQPAFSLRPELEQAVLILKNDAITLRGARNGLLPVFDAYGYYGGTGIGGSINPNCNAAVQSKLQCDRFDRIRHRLLRTPSMDRRPTRASASL